MSKVTDKWMETLRTTANEIEAYALEAEERDESFDSTSLDEAISYIRLAIDELGND